MTILPLREDQRLLCSYLGGSHSYGLNGPDSDEDLRGIFLSTDLSYIIGTETSKTYKFTDTREETTEDVFLMELRHFFSSLKKTNTQCLEALFNTNYINSSPEWTIIRTERYEFIDSERFFKSLSGYIKNERRLMVGERSGLLGSKRKEALQTYGYSFKNASHLIRLAYVGYSFFTTGTFPVNMADTEVYDLLREIKFHPERFNVDDVKELSIQWEDRLIKAYDDRTKDYKFNSELAANVCLELYRPYLNPYEIGHKSCCDAKA